MPTFTIYHDTKSVVISHPKPVICPKTVQNCTSTRTNTTVVLPRTAPEPVTVPHIAEVVISHLAEVVIPHHAAVVIPNRVSYLIPPSIEVESSQPASTDESLHKVSHIASGKLPHSGPTEMCSPAIREDYDASFKRPRSTAATILESDEISIELPDSTAIEVSHPGVAEVPHSTAIKFSYSASKAKPGSIVDLPHNFPEDDYFSDSGSVLKKPCPKRCVSVGPSIPAIPAVRPCTSKREIKDALVKFFPVCRFYFYNPSSLKQAQLVVIDGHNVFRKKCKRNSRRAFLLLKFGHCHIVIVCRRDKWIWEDDKLNCDGMFRALPNPPHKTSQLVRKSDDDLVCIKLAAEFDGIVVSNDKFLNHAKWDRQNPDNLTQAQQKVVRNWVFGFFDCPNNEELKIKAHGEGGMLLSQWLADDSTRTSGASATVMTSDARDAA